MGSINDFPAQNPAEPTKDEAEREFENKVNEVGLFKLQRKDKDDYGSDYQLEVVERDQRTNFRVHVQLKGSTAAANADGSVSVSVARCNLNYLLAPSDSIYVCWHIPTQRLLVKSADDVYAAYERKDSRWTEQESVAVRFSEPFDSPFQQRWHKLVLARGREARNARLEWAKTPPEHLAAAAAHSLPKFSVPGAAADAQIVLADLFGRGEDAIISQAFDQFHAVLRDDPNALDLLYMAEVNLGLNVTANRDRIHLAVDYFARRDHIKPRITPASVSYCLGNAHLALGEHKKAVLHFAVAIKRLFKREYSTTGARCWKNLGTALERLGRWEGARKAYERALELDPDHADSHFALGLWYYRRSNNLSCALEHLERVARSQGSALSLRSVTGWKAKVLFQLELADQAFAAIRSVVDSDHLDGWEWPWCAGLVREYGNRNIASAPKALDFWRRFLRLHPSHIGGMAEEFKTLYFLHERGQNTGIDFARFKARGEALTANDTTDHALVLDWIGHWAETDGDLVDAEAAFRQAFKLKPERYAYCLATTLNRMKRWSDALEILLANTEANGTESTFWFQVAFAREHVDDVKGAIEAYVRAIEIEPGYAVAHFNLGGVLWNSGMPGAALGVWCEALRCFPDHELAMKLRREFPRLFAQDSPT